MTAHVEALDAVELVDGLALVTLISLAMNTTAGVAFLAAFIYKVFHTGVTITCKGDKVRVKKDKNLPRGSVFIVHCNGKEEFREGLSEHSLSEVIKAMVKA